MTLAYLVTTYGYPALLLGTFLEGETVLLLAGFLAHRGYLSLPLVMLVAFAGTFSGDQLWFFLGHFKGLPYLERRPVWKQRAKRIFELLRRHQIPVVLGFRFVYGMRNLTPFVIGSSGFRPWRFVLLNAVGGAIWVAVIAGCGYLFGEAITPLMHDVRRYEIWLLLFIALCGAGLWGWHRWREKRRIG
jgi:membrane protein DedA with SNARE-associated domain